MDQVITGSRIDPDFPTDHCSHIHWIPSDSARRIDPEAQACRVGVKADGHSGADQVANPEPVRGALAGHEPGDSGLGQHRRSTKIVIAQGVVITGMALESTEPLLAVSIAKAIPVPLALIRVDAGTFDADPTLTIIVAQTGSATTIIGAALAL